MRALLFILLMAIYAFAADVADSSVVASADSTKSEEIAVDSLPKQDPPAKNIPLPRQTSYTGRGLSIGVGAGVFKPSEDCDCMGVWQGQLEYFYASWISGGIDVRFFGGDLDNDVMVMYQRYRTNLRLHKAWQNADLFVEPVLAFENISISEFRDQIHRRGRYADSGENVVADSTEADSVASVPIPPEDSLVVEEVPGRSKESCEKMLSLDGFSVGLGAGFGVNLSRLWGLTGSVLFEYNFSNVMELSLIPGVAFNLREVWPWAKKSLISSWISVEFGAQRYFNRGVKDWSNYALVGIQFAI